MLKLLETEPVILPQILAAVLALAVAFGLKLTTDQTAAVMGLAQLLAALIGRANAVPVASHTAQVAAALAKPPPAA